MSSRGSLGRRALEALALSAVGLLGALPAASARVGPEPPLLWLASVALPLGLLAGSLGLRSFLPLVVVPWGIFLVLWPAPVPGFLPVSAFGAVTALYAIASGVGALAPGPAWRGAAVTGLLVLFFAALPTGAGALARPWPPPVAARLFALSPHTLVLECAGLDWLRHPANYVPLGADSIDPGLWRAWDGARAVPTLLVLAALALTVPALLARRSPTDLR